MKLLEYQAASLFEKHGVPIQKGVVIDSAALAAGAVKKIEEAGLAFPVVIKAQVQIGGRGKAGGVKFAENAEEAEKLCARMLGMDIRGFKVKELLVVEKKEIAREWYLSIMLDRYTKSPLLIFSPVGGMDIEETARTSPGRIARVPLNPMEKQTPLYVIDYVLDKTGTDKNCRAALLDLVQKLYTLFFAYYTMLVEINPLAVDARGALTALDGKIEIDDNALPFLPDISAWRDKLQEDADVIEARKSDFLFIPIEDDGSVGVMSNGSGMLMSCIDLISKKGMKVHAALDLGGGATAERIAEAVRIMLGRPKITAVFICVFGGITRCDEVARGACIAMRKNEAAGKQLILRIEGTNKDEAARIVAESGLPITVAEGIPKSVEAIFALHQKEGGGAQ
ncbi:MAG: acetate--CoA ligase family protein [Treponema sp.]|jgi:succinyl-CoA synthetase beta subunit|nr:acetate--CoA ligase family protein [Treponema sp.]